MNTQRFQKKLNKYQEKIRINGPNHVYEKKIAVYAKLCNRQSGGHLTSQSGGVQMAKKIIASISNMIGGVLPATVRGVMDQMTARMTTLTSRMGELQHVMQELRGQKANIERELITAQIQLAEAERQRTLAQSEAEQQLQQLTTQITALREQVGALTADQGVKTALIGALGVFNTSVSATLQRVINSEETNPTTYTTAIDEARGVLLGEAGATEIADAVGTLVTRLNDTITTLCAKRQEFTILTSEVQRLRTQVATSESELATLRQQLTTATTALEMQRAEADANYLEITKGLQLHLESLNAAIHTAEELRGPV